MAVSWGSAGRVRSFLPTLLALQEAGEIRSVAGFRCYILAYVDRRLIRDHNDIDDPRVIEFIEQLILVSTQAPPTGGARSKRAQPEVDGLTNELTGAAFNQMRRASWSHPW